MKYAYIVLCYSDVCDHKSVVRNAYKNIVFIYTVMIQSFQTDWSWQTVQTQIRLLLEEQSDQGLHCLLVHLHIFDKTPSELASLFEF